MGNCCNRQYFHLRWWIVLDVIPWYYSCLSAVRFFLPLIENVPMHLETLLRHVVPMQQPPRYLPFSRGPSSWLDIHMLNITVAEHLQDKLGPSPANTLNSSILGNPQCLMQWQCFLDGSTSMVVPVVAVVDPDASVCFPYDAVRASFSLCFSCQ